MRRIVCAALMTIALTSSAFAANVYLKDGGVIQAKRVWRAGGKVHVLATRHTLTTFETSEVDLKRTFAARHRAVKRVRASEPRPQTATAAPNGAAAPQKPAGSRVKMTLPKLPDKTPESLVPSSGSGGSIKQHKKEMAEKLVE